MTSMTKHVASIVLANMAIFLCTIQAAEVDFTRDIRPILSDKCFACHGPEEEHREGGFRLDQRESAYSETASGETPIVPGHAEKSAVIERITTTDGDLLMPPPSTNKPLTAAEIEKLKSWIAAGAEWEEHWSFIPPQAVAIPEVSEPSWPNNEIDAFILSRLDEEKLSHAPPTDKATLLRRVTFDLTGLPPTPEELAAFLADDSADAYETIVDRLLASPRYGEHMARYWLDAARYGDTHGLHLDNYREIWPYRDWVINAFNSNMPFDQFTIEQMAGDLLPEPTRDQLIATGFNRCNVSTSEGGSIAQEVKMRNVVDRVVTMGTVFMGVTLDCTRCHDHKFDPFTMKDFYSLYAFFNSIDGSPLDGNKKDHAPIMKVPTSEQQSQLQEIDAQLAEMRNQLNGAWPELVQEQQAWETKLLEDQAGETPAWQILVPSEFTSAGGATLEILEDQSILATGDNPATEVYTVIQKLNGANWKGVRLEALVDPSLMNGTGRSANSNTVLTEFEIYTAASPAEGADPAWTRVDINRAWADHAQANGDFKIENAIDGKPKTGWAVEGFSKKEQRTAIFATAAPFGGEQEFLLKVVMRYESQYAQHQFGRFRVAVTTGQPIPVDLPKEILELVKTTERNAEQQQKLQDHFRNQVTTNEAYRKLKTDFDKVTKQRNDLDNSIATTMIWKEKTPPEPAHILKRGEYDQLGDERPRGVPGIFPALKTDWPEDRKGLALWLVDPAHPLTARVTVNRFWQQLFGTGIVKTSEDFGSQGEPPSHPELLDWLAISFIDEGWDVKRLMKRMVLSATYQQSSKVTAEVLQRDPGNRLLARGPRFRLDAEMLRDQALAVSGLLIEKQGGPSVKPPQPDGLWFAVGYSGSNTVRFTADEGPEKVHRRTLYTFIKRTAPPPQMNTFDAPSRESCTVRRERTNTPLQALMLFNDPQYVEAATGLAVRVMRERDSNERRAQRMLELCLVRKPSDKEVQELLTGYQEDLESFRSHPESAQQLIGVGIVPMNEGFEPEQLAAWTMAANLLLNLDEVVTKN